MITECKNKLFRYVLEIMNSIVDGDSINNSFKSYIIDTAVAIKYSGIIIALLANEQKEDIQSKGFKPPLVNNLILKILKDFYRYPVYFNYDGIKMICVNPYYESILKKQILEILGTMQDAVRTFNLTDDFDASSSTKLQAYIDLVADDKLFYINWMSNINNSKIEYAKSSNLRLAYYNYYQPNNGFRSWFDIFGLDEVNNNINKIIKLKFYKDNFNLGDKLPIPEGSYYSSFELAVDKRGLLIGTGYPHFNLTNETNNSDFQLGLFFDYTMGIPIIPSSSIKGFLASFFRNLNDEYIWNRLEDACSTANIEPSIIKPEIMTKLAEDTFGTKDHNPKGTMFFNAYITGRTILPNDPNNTKYNYIVDEDWITPHLLDGKRSKLCEPVPIRFLKISPGVKFKFSFVLTDTIINSNSTPLKITANQKNDLFKILLSKYTLGAKHRTGFGKFIDVNSNPSLKQ